MRVALLHFLSPVKNAKHKGILQKLENAVIKKGYQIDIFNAKTDSFTMRLTGYDYISIIVPYIIHFLKNSGCAGSSWQLLGVFWLPHAQVLLWLCCVGSVVVACRLRCPPARGVSIP